MPITEEFEKEIQEAVENLEPDSEGNTGKSGDDQVATSKGQEDDQSTDSGNTEDQTGDTDGDGDEMPQDEEDEKSEASNKEQEEAQDGISDFVLEKAVQVGIPLDDARGFTSEDALLRTVATLENQYAQSAQLRADIAEIKNVTLKEPDEAIKDSLADLPELDSEQVEPEVIKALNALKKEITSQRKELQDLRTHQNDAVNLNQQAAAHEVEQWFDGEVARLGDDFSEALGEGGHGSLTPGSSQFAKREEIAGSMAVTLAGHKAMGREPPSRDVLFQTAVRSVPHDEFANRGSKKVADMLRKSSGQHIQRPSGQTSKNSQSPDDETAAMLDRKFKM